MLSMPTHRASQHRVCTGLRLSHVLPCIHHSTADRRVTRCHSWEPQRVNKHHADTRRLTPAYAPCISSRARTHTCTHTHTTHLMGSSLMNHSDVSYVFAGRPKPGSVAAACIADSISPSGQIHSRPCLAIAGYALAHERWLLQADWWALGSYSSWGICVHCPVLLKRHLSQAKQPQRCTKEQVLIHIASIVLEWGYVCALSCPVETPPVCMT